MSTAVGYRHPAGQQQRAEQMEGKRKKRKRKSSKKKSLTSDQGEDEVQGKMTFDLVLLFMSMWSLAF